MELYDNQNRPIRIGKEVGRGGEGKVCELSNGSRTSLAKLYHKNPTPAKQEKLRAMVRIADSTLLSVCAWPIATLHATPNGPVVGIEMPHIKDHQEIHALYSPAQRSKSFPDADWAFLVRAASNAARTFELLHSKRQVVGDVNQSNVLVHANATVRLIDADSFQITENGTTHRCEVGVATFTPPELQGKKFTQVDRTANHDCFGLAILIFHLLFLGRHPFAGRPLDSGELSLEKSIHEGRFAYGRDAAAKRIAPPPGVLPLSFVTPTVGSLFERAFEYQASPPLRPTAAEWVAALMTLESGLNTCRARSGHRIPSHLDKCPWCDLISTGQPDFFAVATFRRSGAKPIDLTVDIDAIWLRIEAVQWPEWGTVSASTRANSALKPAPLPCELPPHIPPFTPSPQPAWLSVPPRPSDPRLLVVPPPKLLTRQLKQPVLPRPPQPYLTGVLPPPTMPTRPEMRRLPRILPQRMSGAAAIAGFLCALLSFAFLPPIAIGGIVIGVVFSVWWLVLESQRAVGWREELAERRELWRLECEDIHRKWNVVKREMESLAARENARRKATWQKEVSRRCAIVEKENERHIKLVEAENARRRLEWTKQNEAALIENDRRVNAWRSLVAEWDSQRQQIDESNRQLRAAWEEENRPAKIAWEARQSRRQAAIQLLQREHDKRQEALRLRLSESLANERDWSATIAKGNAMFIEAKARLGDARTRCKPLRAQYRADLNELGKLSIQAQQVHYLEQFIIKKGVIKGLGDARIDVLASWGIETAADIDELKRKSIPGFGPKLRSDLFNWQRSLLAGFKPNAIRSLSPGDLALLNSRYGPRLTSLNTQLLEGEAELRGIVLRTRELLEKIHTRYEVTRKEIDQAQIDLDEVARVLKMV